MAFLAYGFSRYRIVREPVTSASSDSPTTLVAFIGSKDGRAERVTFGTQTHSRSLNDCGQMGKRARLDAAFLLGLPTLGCPTLLSDDTAPSPYGRHAFSIA